MSPHAATERAFMNELIARRLTLGLSQREVAEQISVTKALISLMESGARRPHLDTILAWAAALGLNVGLFEPFRPAP